MSRLEDLARDARVGGILPDGAVTVVDARWYGGDCVELTYKTATGQIAHEVLYRDDEPRLSVETVGRPWAFDGDGDLFRLAAEAQRIRLAYLFDPLLAVHTSVVDPLPHQITAVYEAMLPRQPLRFLLADDPGAGKTIMAGLLMRELQARGDLRRCLVVTPGSLVDQWQDELWRRFGLEFDIVTRATIEESRTGNPFLERSLVLARLDHLSRNEDVQAKLAQTEWDLVVCDEAHKMSANFFGDEVKETKRYKLGKLLGGLTRHFLLMTATPHSGKEADFQLFLALLDADRFEGRFRDGVHQVDASDLMRRMVKEKLLTFDGTPLFPERIATTVAYALSDLEAQLYAAVTEYVRDEMNRAERLTAEGEGRRGTVVGFALQTLQRRLASSPEAIHRSLQRRRERLESRLREEALVERGQRGRLLTKPELPDLPEDEIGEIDEEVTAGELEQVEEQVVDQASAAATIAELEAEIRTLRKLEALALKVRASGTDRKWEELSRLLQDGEEMFDSAGHRRKLIVFSEHRDTLRYLEERIGTLLGRPEAVVAIHGGVGREERRKVQERFTQDKDVQILLATDAAGEGVNLQRAHLMVNYDLPWNPNRLEQRFGRIHRIGQTEVCHLWNLLAAETREGDVFRRLFEKLEVERQALGGQVFDVLGRSFAGTPLRELLLQAIRYGEREDVRQRLRLKVDEALDTDHLRRLLHDRALVEEAMDTRKVAAIRDEMERAEARRLQPHFVEAFFRRAFESLGGTMREREPHRYEITRVPHQVRTRDRQIGHGEAVLDRYERATFEKRLISVPGKPLAAYLCPGHPLLDATLDLVLERHRDLFKRGATLVEPGDAADGVRVLVCLEHDVQDGRVNADGSRRVVSRRMQFVEIAEDGTVRDAGPAPYLDYRRLEPGEAAAADRLLAAPWLASAAFERVAVDHALRDLGRKHLAEVRQRKGEQVDRTRAAVRERLTKEITYWDHRASQLRQAERAGKARGGRLNADLAKRRADELQRRLDARLAELDREQSVSARPPIVVGGALVVPQRELDRLAGRERPDQEAITLVDRLAVAAVVEAERRLAHEPTVKPHNHPGYDIESRGRDGRLRFIEVKGKGEGQPTVTVTKTQILTALNAPEQFILAIVPVRDGVAGEPRYVRRPFRREADFGAASVNYELPELLGRAEAPS